MPNQTLYVPRSDAEFDEWLSNFVSQMQANGATFGFSAAEITALQNAFSDWKTRYPAHLSAQAAAEAAKQAKDQSRRTVEQLARRYTQRLQRHPSMTDAQREAFRITVPDRTRTPVAPPDTAPMGQVDTSQRLVHRVYFWHVDAQGARRGKAPGAAACEIWRKIGGDPPQDLSECEFVGAPSRSPYRVVYSGSEAGVTVHYILRWRTARGEVGPISETLSATVTG